MRALLYPSSNTLAIEVMNISTCCSNLPNAGEEISTISFHINDGDRILTVNNTSYTMLVPNASTSIVTMSSSALSSPESWPQNVWMDIVVYNVTPGSVPSDFVITPDIDGDNSDVTDPVISILVENGFNQSVTIISTTLPINVVDFQATNGDNLFTILTWTSVCELNTDFFEIERSQDSHSWESIGTVKAMGDSKSKVSYEFIDNNITLSRSKDNIYYYRLRMVDRDGQFTYSEIRDVDFGRLKTPELIIHPNPTNDIINLDLTIFDKNGGPIEITVYDMNGKQVLSRITSDTGREIVDISTLPANTYNIKVKQGELIYNEKVIKVD